MNKDKRVLGIVTARGGSKRLPEKNILPLAGKPMIAWTLEAAQQASSLAKVVVSTDSLGIAQVCEHYGVPVPWLRPAALATDTATTKSVIEHALEQEENQGKQYDAIMILQPTSPLRTAEDIDNAVALYRQKNAQGVTSVSPVEHPPQWINTLPEDLSLKGFLSKDVVGKRSQTLPQYYRLNGAVTMMDAQAVRDKKDFWSLDGIYAYLMDPMRSVDIDSELDFLLAETILTRQGGLHG